MVLGDPHCSASLHERHISDTNETKDVPKIGDFMASKPKALS
jgi:hypothetical protein